LSISTEAAALRRLSVVPPFPPIAARLLTTLAGNSIQIKELADLISSDALFTGRILQYANSCQFGLLQPVRNVRHALVTLGLDRTRRITITAATSAYSRVAMRTPELKRCWQHTIATAVLSEEISHRCGAFTEPAYAAGIMHDIGRLGLLVAFPSVYENTLRDAAARCLDLLDYERETFGVDHAEAGRWLCAKWNLPEEFHIIAGRHHDRCEGADLSLLKIVHVACRLADHFGYDVSRPLKPEEFDEIVSVLPATARELLAQEGSDMFRQKIDERVRAFDNEPEHNDPKTAWTSIREEFAPDELNEDITPTASAEPDNPESQGKSVIGGFLSRLFQLLFGKPHIRDPLA
jgi:HD-like signal output (HDOD) protein